jgi:hypothetical protein
LGLVAASQVGPHDVTPMLAWKRCDPVEHLELLSDVTKTLSLDVELKCLEPSSSYAGFTKSFEVFLIPVYNTVYNANGGPSASERCCHSRQAR